MKLNALLLLSALAVLTACTEPNKPAPLAVKAAEQTAIPNEKADSDLFKGNIVAAMDKAVLCILQDRAGNYWFGTQNSGAYRYDGEKTNRIDHKGRVAIKIAWLAATAAATKGSRTSGKIRALFSIFQIIQQTFYLIPTFFVMWV